MISQPHANFDVLGSLLLKIRVIKGLLQALILDWFAFHDDFYGKSPQKTWLYPVSFILIKSIDWHIKVVQFVGGYFQIDGFIGQQDNGCILEAHY